MSLARFGSRANSACADSLGARLAVQQQQGGFQQGGFGGGRTCYSCGGVGHLSRDCVNAQKCFNCGGQGHVSRECPQPAGQKSCYKVSRRRG